MTRSFLTIIAVVGLIFLLALFCWLSGSDNPLDDPGEDCPNGDWPSTPADFDLLHAAPLTDARQRDHV